jgi:hypothetical protein
MEFTPEISLEEYASRVEELPYTVSRSEEDEHVFLVEGPRIEKMLGYTNLEDNKGFKFFQDFMVKNGIIDELKALGMYYDRPAEELIFLRTSEHISLHREHDKKINGLISL